MHPDPSLLQPLSVPALPAVRAASCFVFLGVLTVFDCRSKHIPLLPCLLFAAEGCLLYIPDSLPLKGVLLQAGAALLPGLCLLLLSRLTRGGIGSGDGLTVLVLGLYLRLSALLSVLSFSLLFAAGFAAVMLMTGKMRRMDRFPFLPFLLAGFTAYEVLICV